MDILNFYVILVSGGELSHCIITYPILLFFYIMLEVQMLTKTNIIFVSVAVYFLSDFVFLNYIYSLLKYINQPFSLHVSLKYSSEKNDNSFLCLNKVSFEVFKSLISLFSSEECITGFAIYL